MKRNTLIFVLLAGAFRVAFPAVAQTESADVYIVSVRPEAALDRLGTIAEQLARTYGGTVLKVSTTDDTVVMRLPRARVSTAARDPRVTAISPADSAGRPSSVAGDVAEVVSWRDGVSYAYDGAGNVTTIGTDGFVYDVASRLVESKVNGETRTYEYDAFGNRTKCRQGTSDCQGHTINLANNRIAGANNYDGAGNVKTLDAHQYSYDALNMQTRDVDTFSGVTREYVYTADDERIAVYTVDQWWRWTIRDPTGKVLREYMSQDGPDGKGTDKWQWAKDYVWREGVLVATRHVPPGTSTAVTYHYHVDHLGTPRRITDDDDRIVGFHDYAAFGPETSTGKAEPSLSLFKYTGHERDVVNSSTSSPLDYMHARFYSAALGRFMSVDRGNSQRVTSPQTWNRYSYALNNPIKVIDPDGREWRKFADQLGITRTLEQIAARSPDVKATLDLYDGPDKPNLEFARAKLGELEDTGMEEGGNFKATNVTDANFSYDIARMDQKGDMAQFFPSTGKFLTGARYEAGRITFSADLNLKFNALSPTKSDKETIRIIIHEIGHAHLAASNPLLYFTLVADDEARNVPYDKRKIEDDAYEYQRKACRPPDLCPKQ